MKKWWMIVLAIAVVFAIVLTVALYNRPPVAYRRLVDKIQEDGYAEGSYTVLDMKDDAKAFRPDKDSVMIYRVMEDDWGEYTGIVRFYMTPESVRNGVYYWTCNIHHTEGDFSLEGTLTAATLTPKGDTVTCEFTYGEDKASTALFKYELKQIAASSLCDTVAAFDAYLLESDMELTIADYGFEALKAS